MPALPQGLAHILGRAVGDEPSSVQHQHPVCQGQDLLQPVLGDKHRGAQLPVDAAHGGKKFRGGDGVELSGGLVQQQHRGLHHHHRRQIEQLLLPAGQAGNILIKPILNAEKGGHFRHTAADGGGVQPQTFQPEGQLVPHLVGDDLIVGILQNEADALALLPLGERSKRPSLEYDLALPGAVRGQNGLELPQKRGLAAAGGTAEGDEFPGADGKAQTVQRLVFLLGIGKAHIFERIAVHLRSSFRSRIRGDRHSAE